ncbi:zinc ribbon domain-containing protein [Ktedonosporobacter rubrisoli]|uniref:Zinc ribbon domain-containing protein n=1 Tax=Ktedonosporobacter rubrisoli TaxID=2509675 RepID=A0A4P6JU07_KTERU|nr:zinc ribbon domain-containing protein [Ktedonosporobacter rubrisoli]QBD79077.1 zinc ribbon domain-containing protein [Ktedonosporobacter rubrisoli]
MNCRYCNKPINAHARFCSNCGKPIAIPPPEATPSPPEALLEGDEETVEIRPLPASQHPEWAITETSTQSLQQQESAQSSHPELWEDQKQSEYSRTNTPPTLPIASIQSQTAQPAPPPAQPLALQYPTTHSTKGSKAPSATINVEPTKREGPRRSTGCCILGCLGTLVLLAVLLGAGWFFALRPYLHDTAQSQIDQATSAAIARIPPEVALLPAGPLKIQETTLNSLLNNMLGSTTLIQNPAAQISPDHIRFMFQIYGNSCAITAVPQVTNGQLAVTNMSIDGIFGLIMTPAEMTNIVNQHLLEAQKQIKHNIRSVQLLNQEIDLQLG